jgi:hypothetical protein
VVKTRKWRTRLRGEHQGGPLLSFLLLAIWGCAVAAASISAQANSTSEYAVKAAFLFHFAQFVEWPPEAFKDANSPLTYCTVGDDPFRGALDDSLRAKVIGDRGIRVQHLKQADATHGCQVLFIGGAESKRAAAGILANVKGSAILTVGESQDFAEDGGMIEFCPEGNKIRFNINLATVSAAKLKMSARLLTLAKTVIGTQGGS